MASRDIKMCVPELQGKYWELKKYGSVIGIEIMLTCTSRWHLEQVALFAQGRNELAIVNHTTANVGLPPITAAENKKVTWTVNSKHIIHKEGELCRAFDITILKEGTKIPHWCLKTDVDSNGLPDYLELALIGEKVGLIPGAFWDTPDSVHYEI